MCEAPFNTFVCLGQEDYRLPLPLLCFQHLNSASIRGQRTRWCWPAGPHRDSRGSSSCCTDMMRRYPQLLRVCIPHGDSDPRLWLLCVSFLPFPLRWTPRSCSPGLKRSTSLWGFCKGIQPSLNSSAVCTRAKTVATAPLVHICSQSGKKVPIIFYLYPLNLLDKNQSVWMLHVEVQTDRCCRLLLHEWLKA